MGSGLLKRINSGLSTTYNAAHAIPSGSPNFPYVHGSAEKV